MSCRSDLHRGQRLAQLTSSRAAHLPYIAGFSPSRDGKLQVKIISVKDLMMLEVSATFQINRVEQSSEFGKKSLKMCSERNGAKLICCFLSQETNIA